MREHYVSHNWSLSRQPSATPLKLSAMVSDEGGSFRDGFADTLFRGSPAHNGLHAGGIFARKGRADRFDHGNIDPDWRAVWTREFGQRRCGSGGTWYSGVEDAPSADHIGMWIRRQSGTILDFIAKIW